MNHGFFYSLFWVFCDGLLFSIWASWISTIIFHCESATLQKHLQLWLNPQNFNGKLPPVSAFLMEAAFLAHVMSLQQTISKGFSLQSCCHNFWLLPSKLLLCQSKSPRPARRSLIKTIYHSSKWGRKCFPFWSLSDIVKQYQHDFRFFFRMSYKNTCLLSKQENILILQIVRHW